MPPIRKTILLSVAAIAALSLSVASASAATFAPAGDKFQATAVPAVLKIEVIPGTTREIVCGQAKLSGTLSNPASSTATAPVGSVELNNGAGKPCTLRFNGIVAGTAQITPSASYALKAYGTTDAGLAFGASDIYIVPNTGEPPCHETIPNSMGYKGGVWSNEAQTLAFTNYSAFATSYGGSYCVGGTQKLTATFQIKNLTKPGTPITIQP